MADLTETLRGAIDRAVKAGTFPTLYAVAKAAGLKPELIYKFHDGRGDLRLTSAAKLAAALGLVLVPAAGGPVAGKAKAKGKGRRG